jgi:hypothetical protein
MGKTDISRIGLAALTICLCVLMLSMNTNVSCLVRYILTLRTTIGS